MMLPRRLTSIAAGLVGLVATSASAQPSSDPPPGGSTAYSGPSTVPAAPPRPPIDGGAAPPSGVGFELNLGLGLADPNGEGPAPLIGVGVGPWIVPGRLAFTLRGTYLVSSAYRLFIGPSLQYWTSRHLWFSGGLGYSRVFKDPCGAYSRSECATNAVAADLRVGYSLGPTEHRLNAMFEVTPAWYGSDFAGAAGTAVTIAIAIGYQFL